MRCGDEDERIARWIVGIEVAWRAENPELSVSGSSGGCQGKRIGGQTQVSEDPADDGWIGDQREDEHGGGTAGALEGIDEEDAPQELSPGQVRSTPGRFRMRHPGRTAVGLRGSCGVRGLRRGRRLERWRGQVVSGSGAVGEAAVIPDRMGVRCGDDRGQAAQATRTSRRRSGRWGTSPHRRAAARR